MSATLEAEPVAKYLGDCPDPGLGRTGFSGGHSNIFRSHDERPITEQAAEIVTQIVSTGDPGDILIFMPGMGEINAHHLRLPRSAQPRTAGLHPFARRTAAGRAGPGFRAQSLARKVVVATNVAETSVTIDGIIHVIDSGLARVARYDAERGLGTLFIEPISRASADQRAGRAGRTAPGTCHRLWTESEHLNRPARNTPEIQRSDLAEIVLLCIRSE